MKEVDELGTVNSISRRVQATREYAELEKLCNSTILCDF